MKIKQIIESEQWIKYLDREIDFLLFDFCNKIYMDILKQETGFGFSKVLGYYKNGVGTWYLSEKELNNCSNHFLNLIKNDEQKIINWLEKEKESHIIFQNLKNKKNKEIINDFFSIFLFNTEIPYRLLASLEEEKDYIGLKEKLFKIRFVSLWPIIMQNYISTIYNEISNRTNIKIDLIKMIKIDELLNYYETGYIVSQVELLKRFNDGFYTYDLLGQSNLYYSEIDFLKIDSNESLVKGVIANQGKVKGKAKIINSLESCSKFEEGDILISINTNPSLIHIIKKASAIITDEGGITSHAAIVSREFDIPCIIGTKIATKVFKDNDLVEVDANNGIARKLK
jgi:phosphohistidine swiveling domain-containing protein